MLTNVIVLEQRNVGAHFGDGAYVDHDGVLNLGEALRVEPAGKWHYGNVSIGKSDTERTRGQSVITYSNC